MDNFPKRNAKNADFLSQILGQYSGAEPEEFTQDELIIRPAEPMRAPAEKPKRKPAAEPKPIKVQVVPEEMAPEEIQPMPSFDQDAALEQELKQSGEDPDPFEFPSQVLNRRQAILNQLNELRKKQEEYSNSENLKKLQDDYQSNMKNLGLLQGMNTISSAVASGFGGKTPDQTATMAALREQFKHPMDAYKMQGEDLASKTKNLTGQLELDNEFEMNDPNSDISVFARARAKPLLEKAGMPAEQLENMTAHQLEKLGLFKPDQGVRGMSIQNIRDSDGVVRKYAINPYDGSRTVIGEAGFSTQFRTDPGSQETIGLNPAQMAPMPVPVTGPGITSKGQAPQTMQDMTGVKAMEGVSYSDLPKGQKDSVDEVKKRMSDDPIFKASRQQATNAQVAEEMIKKNAPGSAGAVARSLLGTYESGGRFTDQDIEQFKGNPDLYSRLNRFLVKTFDPEKALSDKDQKDLLKILQIASAKQKALFNQSMTPYVDDLKQKGFDPKFSEQFLTQGFSQSVNSPQAPKPGEIRKGFEFLGGDYKDKKNWKKVKQ